MIPRDRIIVPGTCVGRIKTDSSFGLNPHSPPQEFPVFCYSYVSLFIVFKRQVSGINHLNSSSGTHKIIRRGRAEEYSWIRILITSPFINTRGFVSPSPHSDPVWPANDTLKFTATSIRLRCLASSPFRLGKQPERTSNMCPFHVALAHRGEFLSFVLNYTTFNCPVELHLNSAQSWNLKFPVKTGMAELSSTSIMTKCDTEWFIPDDFRW